VSKPDAQKKKNESKPNQILVTTNFGNDKFRQSQTQGKKRKEVLASDLLRRATISSTWSDVVERVCKTCCASYCLIAGA